MKLPHHLLARIIHTLHDIFVAGHPAETAVAQALREHQKWGSRDRRLFAESVYEIVRGRRWFWHLAGLPAAEYDVPEAQTEARLWAVWAAYWLTSAPETAEATAPPVPRALPDIPELAGFDPATPARQAQADVPPTVRESWPDWLDQRLAEELGETWPATRAALNHPASVFLRVNTLKTKKVQLQLRLLGESVLTDEVPGVPTALRLRERAKVASTASFKEGLFELQDAASQQIAPLLQPQPGQTVIDACAGAGGKALHLAALMNNEGRIVAVDPHGGKLAELRRRAARAGVSIIETRELPPEDDDATTIDAADAVLLDVPCSGLGVIRRRPDTKWKLDPEGLEQVMAVQAGLLRRWSGRVKPGGCLVYATCSILPSENQGQVRSFLAEQASASPAWALEEEISLDPAATGFDGFYAARLRRTDR